jgi:hypothetical protein
MSTRLREFKTNSNWAMGIHTSLFKDWGFAFTSAYCMLALLGLCFYVG